MGAKRRNRPPYGPPARQGDVDCGFCRNDGPGPSGPVHNGSEQSGGHTMSSRSEPAAAVGQRVELGVTRLAQSDTGHANGAAAASTQNGSRPERIATTSLRPGRAIA